MKCPRCGFEQQGDDIECIKCGIVFAKYSPAPFRHLSPKPDEESPETRAFLKDLLFPVQPETNIIFLIGRVIVFLVMLIWGMRFIFTPLASDYAGSSFMHLINLPFHEAGHILFRAFGQFMMMLGGSLTQLLVPFVCLAAFLLKTRDAFAASVSLWWLGQNLIDLAPYINDARALQLMLLGGVTGRDVEDFHDWEFILRNLGLLEYDHLLARAAHVSGALLILCALLWGGYVLIKQYRSVRTKGGG
jgi:hypothetical protein